MTLNDIGKIIWDKRNKLAKEGDQYPERAKFIIYLDNKSFAELQKGSYQESIFHMLNDKRICDCDYHIVNTDGHGVKVFQL